MVGPPSGTCGFRGSSEVWSTTSVTGSFPLSSLLPPSFFLCFLLWASLLRWLPSNDDTWQLQAYLILGGQDPRMRKVFSFPECTLNCPGKLIAPASIVLYPLSCLGLGYSDGQAWNTLTVCGWTRTEMKLAVRINPPKCLQVVHEYFSAGASCWSIISCM